LTLYSVTVAEPQRLCRKQNRVSLSTQTYADPSGHNVAVLTKLYHTNAGSSTGDWHLCTVSELSCRI